MVDVPPSDAPVEAPTPVVVHLATGHLDGPIVDTGDADGAETAALVAWARMHGATAARTREPRAARRAATVIDAIRAAEGAG